ncbi:MAG: single-stranded-DNA-specific exonuclease RecJ [Alphaproteobacteria bacterium]|nr:single-stranded-DNA-specific exonuclease RecJ [Alphaproteobacteria bacterium]
MRRIVDKSMLGRTWVVDAYEDSENSTYATDRLVEKILSRRGITSPDDVEHFLNPSIKNNMPDPSTMRDMDVAARVIADAVLAHDKIAIYGDYDVDGITSTAVLVKYLRALGCDVTWHLPTREGEGYGLNTSAIDDIIAGGAKLIITVDCGISGIDEVAYAKSRGLKIVVTDHHSPDETLPAGDAVVNPKRADDTSGLSYMAGVGVAFMTVVALRRELRGRDLNADLREKIDNINPSSYLDLVALGTICDTMPLVGLNRAFVATGLQVLDRRQNLGLRVLMDVAEIKHASVYSAGFALGPRLNAAGRLDSAAPALELLLTDNSLVASDLAHQLNDMNRERIDIQNAIMARATEMADRCCESGKCSLFVCGDGWHGGVMGIIAGRLKDRYCLPTCVATKSDGMINGSGRSIAGVDLGHIIHMALAAGILSEGGGHAAAAGFSLPEGNENAFCEFLESAVREQLNGQAPERETLVDAEIDAAGATLDLIEKLSVLEPFGQGNPEPTLVLHGARLRYATVMGNGSHLRGNVSTMQGNNLAFVGFNLVGTPVGNFLLDDANTNTTITLLGKLKKNEYNGHVSPQFMIEDIALG